MHVLSIDIFCITRISLCDFTLLILSVLITRPANLSLYLDGNVIFSQKGSPKRIGLRNPIALLFTSVQSR